MANRIQGIIVEIGGDVTGLNKALSGVDKNIRQTQTELKDVNRLLKLDPTNTELLQQKQKLLAQAVGDTKDRLNALKSAEQQAQEQFKKGDITQQQYDALKREIIDTEQKLKSLEDQVKKVETAFTVSLKVAGDKLQEVGGKIEGAGKSFAPISAAAAAGGIAAFKMAADVADAMGATEEIYGNAADAVKDWAENLDSYYGIAHGSALEYSNMMGSMLQNIGGLTEQEAAKQAQTLIELAGDLTAMYGGTTADAVQALTGALKGNNTMLDNYGMAVNDALIKQKAMEMGLISSTGEMGLAEKQAATLALIMEQSSAAQGQAAREADGASGSMRTFTVEAKNLATSFGEELLPIITPFIQKITSMIERFSGLDHETKNLIVTIGLIVAAIGPALIIGGKLVSGVGSLISIIATLSGAVLPALSAAFSFLAANPIVLIIAAIVAVIAIVQQLWDKNEAFREAVTDIWSKVTAVFQTFDNWLKGIFQTDWTKSFGIFGEILNAFFRNVNNIWDSIKQIFGGIITFLKGVFTGDWQLAWQGVVDLFGGIFGGIVEIAKTPLNALIGFLNAAIEGINTLIKGLNKISFDIPDWVPGGLGGKSFGINIPEIGKIPLLAKGGVLHSGSAIVGEAGAELLSMINGRAVVTPLTDGTTQRSIPPIQQTNYFTNYEPQDGAAVVRDLDRQLGRLYQ